MDKYCSTCGFTVVPEHRFCQGCGKPLKAAQAAASITAVTELPAQPAKDPPGEAALEAVRL